MGYISAVIDPGTNVTLARFDPVEIVLDLSPTRRSATYTIWAVDSGVDPFGTGPLPLNKLPLSYQWRVRFPVGGGGADGARDALMLALGGGKQVRLEYTPDGGLTKRYYDAKPVGVPLKITPPTGYYADFKVDFEAEPVARGFAPLSAARKFGQAGLKFGQAGVTYGSTATQVLNAATNTFYLFTDGSLPTISTSPTGRTYPTPRTIPTADDTALVVTVAGAFGGSGGFRIANTATRYGTGATTITYCDFSLPAPANGTVAIACGTRGVTLGGWQPADGTPGWAHLSVPEAQDCVLRIVANAQNILQVNALGTTTGYTQAGTVLFGWTDKYY